LLPPRPLRPSGGAEMFRGTPRYPCPIMLTRSGLDFTLDGDDNVLSNALSAFFSASPYNGARLTRRRRQRRIVGLCFQSSHRLPGHCHSRIQHTALASRSARPLSGDSIAFHRSSPSASSRSSRTTSSRPSVRASARSASSSRARRLPFSSPSSRCTNALPRDLL